MYMLMLSSELVNENSLPHVRNAAGLALKNTLTAKVRKQLEKETETEIYTSLSRAFDGNSMTLFPGNSKTTRVHQPMARSRQRHAKQSEARGAHGVGV